MFDQIKSELHEFGVDFDVYFHENSLHESGAVRTPSTGCASLGPIYEADGAVWLRTTDLGDTKDRGHRQERRRGRLHRRATWPTTSTSASAASTASSSCSAPTTTGYIGRMMAMCAAFGDTPGVNLEILIGQLVNLVKDGAPVG
jgi:arginyl-tRNA synthetase